ncbi:unnamed protein product, partial [Prorocentrum cordatum]
ARRVRGRPRSMAAFGPRLLGRAAARPLGCAGALVGWQGGLGRPREDDDRPPHR